MDKPHVDIDNPIHRASFYVLRLGGTEVGSLETFDHQTYKENIVKPFLIAAGEPCTPDEVMEAVVFYAWSFTHFAPGLNPSLAMSIFMDGLLYGIGAARGVRGEPITEGDDG